MNKKYINNINNINEKTYKKKVKTKSKSQESSSLR
tara:strand:- start:736 stop:840 length:105 start_codon:yes stop_codon:yes gene_type:complete